jgi:hypothetical protein
MARLSEKYIAGFLDSDGSIETDVRYGRKFDIALTFSQKTSQDKVLYLIQDALMGGNVITRVVNDVSYSKYQLYGQKAVQALNRIAQHLVIKRHYAYACLALHGKPVSDAKETRNYLKSQRRIKSLPLPNFPPRKWLAGYFDGDGCLSVTGIREPSGSAQVVAHIASSHYDTAGIEIIHKVFGGCIHDMRDGSCRQFVLSVSPSKAKEFLGYFAKHLVTKKEQAYYILGCAAMGHFRDGKTIKAALKQLKTHEHRLNEGTVDVSNLLAEVRDLPKLVRTRDSYLPMAKRSTQAIVGPAPAG